MEAVIEEVSSVIGEIPVINLKEIKFLSVSLSIWVVVLTVLLMVVLVIRGYRNGIVTELSSFLGLASALFVIWFFSEVIKDHIPLEWGRIPRALIFLVIAIVIYQIVKYLSVSIGRSLRKIPFIGFLSGILGALAGCCKALMIMLLIQKTANINIIGAIEEALVRVPFLN